MDDKPSQFLETTAIDTRSCKFQHKAGYQ
uniref:Uncharacterized protein n=1 Tax=Rhizophora mucronata TaxID=61149 RepID=A0A2P2QMI9_RHIMU